MTKVKICGITNIEDALHAAACGAEMLGLNFCPRSPRYIAPEAARKITASLPSSVETVGVFVNEARPDVVRRIAEAAGVGSVQLHGDEDPEFCAALMDLHVIKAIRVSGHEALSRIAAFSDCRILLDSPSEAFGGSGKTFDWEIARKVRELVPYLMLAGGLDAELVGEAVRLVRPDAVDACSLLERAPGSKDRLKVECFIAAVHDLPIRAGAKNSE